MKNTIIFIIITSLQFALAGCKQKSGYVNNPQANPIEDSCGLEFCEKNIKETIEHLVPPILAHLDGYRDRQPIIACGLIKNKTSQHIDTGLLRTMLITELVRNRVQVLDDAKASGLTREIGKGMPDLPSPANQGAIHDARSAPNLLLTGDIMGSERAEGEMMKLYINITLRLVDLKSGKIAWSDQKEFLKVAKRRRMTF